jgi:hypothetical protein
LRSVPAVADVIDTKHGIRITHIHYEKHGMCSRFLVLGFCPYSGLIDGSLKGHGFSHAVQAEKNMGFSP